MSLVHAPGGDAGWLRRWSLYIFARYLEVPLLGATYQLLRGRYRRLGATAPVRTLAAALGAPFAYAGDTSRAVPMPQVLTMIDALEGAIAVGPCRCRSAHGACDHPIETDLVIHAGVEAWTRAFPDNYRLIDKAEAKQIVSECSKLGMWQMVFVHCPVGEHSYTPAQRQDRFHLGHEYVICNCCTCGCVPYILNRELGQRVYPLLRGEFVAWTHVDRCTGDGTCVEACPFGARALIDGCAALVGTCFGCGLCAAACPCGAIQMRPRRGQYS
jgi:ferredoxin